MVSISIQFFRLGGKVENGKQIDIKKTHTFVWVSLQFKFEFIYFLMNLTVSFELAEVNVKKYTPLAKPSVETAFSLKS